MLQSLRNLRSVSRLARHLGLFVVILWLYGCSSYLSEFYFGDLFGGGGATTQKNAEQLAMDGMDQMREKDYGEAYKTFQQLRERYPYSKYAILAELKLGDAAFYNKKYADAAIAYEEFVRLHPRNEVVPYVLYQIGMCHFLAFSTIDRDQEETQFAMEAFQRVIQAFPKTEYAQRARKQLFECQKRIVAHEFYVGQFYYRQGEYASAKERLERISTNFPEAVKDLSYEDRIEVMLADCRKHDNEEKKSSIWTRLGF